jgi:hypothetical protein
MSPPQLWKAIQQNGQWPRGNCFVCGKPGHFAKQCTQRQGQEQQQKSMPQATANSVPPPPALCPKCHRGRHWANQCLRFTTDGQPINPTQENQPQGNYRGGPAARPLQTMAAMTFKPAQNLNGGFQFFKEPPQGVSDWTSVPPPEAY